jgi:anti-sigma regulatory factor (Ser/Thr protein kinase)
MTGGLSGGTIFEIRRNVPASLASVDGISREMRRRLAGTCSGADLFASELLVREALTNAVVHGCGLDRGQQVGVSIRVRSNRVVVSVRDEGAGFNWRNGMTHSAGDDDTSGRGLSIYRAYADRVRFNRSGNEVTFVRHFQPVAAQ